VHGLRELTDDPTFNVVIVDNGTTQKSALTILESLEDDSRFTVLKQPVPFNFSALSNEGARRSLSRVLVFMNNDIEMQDRNWLRPLIDLATQPDVGVVGAKLLFPTGRIQHAGVTLGLGGVAGHLYSNKAIQGAAYLQHLDATREVSAVTAACCAIERSKFESLGGFDEVNFPVEFSDIDLCLRAMARGWSNVVAAKAVLIHHESETRGVARSKTYETERKIFLERWMHIVRDDPYFHPGLSLFSLMPALN
jgi:GT2 family glycosyltransferase